MSLRILVGSIVLCASVAASAAPAAPGQRIDPSRSEGPAIAMLDPERSLRRAVDIEVAGEIVGRLQREAHRGSVWTETMFDTLAVATGKIHEFSVDGRMEDSNRHEIAALTALLVVDRVVELHPEMLPVVGASLSMSSGGSPIERICACDKSGSRSCGCKVQNTGSGSCEYKVMCPSVLKAGCSAVNVELCVAQTVLGIFSATE
jgi:hypothetical protein